jgi:tetratricopeptide (TPR) repeat protein
MYLESGQAERAAEVLEEGLDRNPDSEELTLTLATFYLERGDYEQAELYMERLANLNPDYEMLPLMRQTLAILRSNPMPGAGKPRLMPAPPRLPGPPKKQH